MGEIREGCREMDRGENMSTCEGKADRDNAWSITAAVSCSIWLGSGVMAVHSLEHSGWRGLRCSSIHRISYFSPHSPSCPPETPQKLLLELNGSFPNQSLEVCYPRQQTNTVTITGWNTQIQSHNGKKTITGCIPMNKNITQHLADQPRHAVTSFWWCNQLYTADPCTVWRPADRSDVLQGRNV